MKQIILFFLTIILLVPAKANAHKYYVSIAEIAYNQETEKLEVGMKLFFDDLQQAISIEQNKMINDPISDYEAEIAEYIFNHFSVTSNDKSLNFTVIGFEDELDAVWVYLESDNTKLEKEWKVRNTIFTAIYPKQVNIINFYPDKKNMKVVEGLLLNSKEKEGLIRFE